MTHLTTHLTEDQFVLHYYGESENAAAVQLHLAGCPVCRDGFQSLSRTLDACYELPVPERGEGYEAAVWRRLAPSLPPGPRPRARWSWPRFRPLVWAPVLAGLIAAAFLAGTYFERHRPNPVQPAIAQAISPAARERIFLVALGDHLDRSQMMLAEFVNAEPGKAADFPGAQQRAEELLSENRLYRQTAALTGRRPVAEVLDELERVLVDIAHSPSRLSSKDLEELQQRIETQGLLFKIRVIDANVRQQERTPASPRSKSETL